MNKITHFVNNEGNVVIEAVIGNVTYVAVIIPRIIAGQSYIPESSIDTTGCDNPDDIKNDIISFVTTHRGKYNELPLIVERNK